MSKYLKIHSFVIIEMKIFEDIWYNFGLHQYLHKAQRAHHTLCKYFNKQDTDLACFPLCDSDNCSNHNHSAQAPCSPQLGNTKLFLPFTLKC